VGRRASSAAQVRGLFGVHQVRGRRTAPGADARRGVDPDQRTRCPRGRRPRNFRHRLPPHLAQSPGAGHPVLRKRSRGRPEDSHGRQWIQVKKKIDLKTALQN